MNLRHRVSSAGSLPRGAQLSRRLFVAATVLTLLAVSSVASAIDIAYDYVNASGANGPFTFDDQPVVTDWSYLTIGGTAGDIDSLAALTTRIQQVTAASVNGVLPVDTAAVPTKDSARPVRWNSTLGALQTGPTSVNLGLLMGTFVNTSENFITDFLVTYDVGKFAPIAETIQGHAVYYSTTGLADSWVPLGAYGGESGSTFFFANDLGQSWGNNPLYILWADDNGPPSDELNTIDNLFMEVAIGDPKEPPPPPTPVFGNISPPQAQDFETAGSGYPINNVGGTVMTTAGTQALQVNNGSISASPDQVDLRTIDDSVQKVVSMDLKAWETSQTSDFEADDHITITADISEDGLAFTTITLLDLRGAPVLDPFDPTVPNPADQLRATFGPTEAVNNADQPFQHFEFTLPASANTVRLRVDIGNNSGTEFMAIDNIAINGVVVPEPGTLVMFGLAAVGLVGYGIRRRRAA